jgi:hypothetical protein
MQVSNISTSNNWDKILSAARTTVNKGAIDKFPNSVWRRKMLLAEHSPIRKLKVEWTWRDIKRWVSDHFVRHKHGIEHWVKTDRSDRTGVNRDELSQSSLTNHECEANAQSIINISRKRLCSQASKETREAWRTFLEELKDKEPELYSVCVPECIYRGFCPEINTCSFDKTIIFKENLHLYRYGKTN